MTALIVTDLDRCCVDNAARAAQATRPDGSMDWPALFDPDAILRLDAPMPGPLTALQLLDADGAQLWYVTAREETCQEATVAWLTAHDYPQPDHVICRARFQRSAEFKASTVAALARTNPVILFVDDNPANCAAVAVLDIAGLAIREGWETP